MQDPESIWTEFHERLLGFIRMRVPQEDDAEDIRQDVFVRILSSADRLDEVQNITAWMYRITRNAIADHHRRQDRTGKDARLDADVPALESTGLDEEASSRELAQCLRPLLARLPEEYRDAVAETDLEGASQKVAAAHAGISLSGMKSRVQRGRQKLKAELLDCCRVDLDARRSVIDYTRRNSCDCQ